MDSKSLPCVDSSSLSFCFKSGVPPPLHPPFKTPPSLGPALLPHGLRFFGTRRRVEPPGSETLSPSSHETPRSAAAHYAPCSGTSTQQHRQCDPAALACTATHWFQQRAMGQPQRVRVRVRADVFVRVCASV